MIVVWLCNAEILNEDRCRRVITNIMWDAMVICMWFRHEVALHIKRSFKTEIW